MDAANRATAPSRRPSPGSFSRRCSARFPRAQASARDIELTDAETALTQARLDVIDAFIDRRIADALLRQATGDPVERSAR